MGVWGQLEPPVGRPCAQHKILLPALIVSLVVKYGFAGARRAQETLQIYLQLGLWPFIAGLMLQYIRARRALIKAGRRPKRSRRDRIFLEIATKKEYFPEEKEY